MDNELFSSRFDWFDYKFWAGAALLGVSAAYCGKIWYDQRYFKQRGIPTAPASRFMFGHLLDVSRKGYSVSVQNWTKMLGKTYGIYEGHTPMLITSDLDLIQEVFIKKFSYFAARKLGPHQVSDYEKDVDLFGSAETRWKKMRTLMNPTFTTAKIKLLLPLMQKCSNRLLDEIESSVNTEVNISNLLDRLTMDTIFNCAFGIDLDAQKDKNNPFLVNGIRLFRDRADHTKSIMIRLLFPELKPVFKALSGAWSFLTLRIFGDSFVLPVFALFSKINYILDTRIKSLSQENATIKRDYLQILLEAYDENFKDQMIDKNESVMDMSQMSIVKKLTIDEVKSNVVIFLLAGFETTASCLSYCMHILTQYPDEMRKLQDEIDGSIEADLSNLNYDTVQSMSYLDMFVKEVLRVYPIANLAINRRCVHPIAVKGINMSPGLIIAVDVLSLHNDPEYWTDPDRFNPERFSSSNKINPLVYIPFGIGSRLCIGMRFALIEVKITLAKILRQYDILASENTPTVLEFSEGVVRRPKHGIPILIKKRVN